MPADQQANLQNDMNDMIKVSDQHHVGSAQHLHEMRNAEILGEPERLKGRRRSAMRENEYQNATDNQYDYSPNTHRGAIRKMNNVAHVSQSLPDLNLNQNKSHDGAVAIGPPVEYNALYQQARKNNAEQIASNLYKKQFRMGGAGTKYF